MKSRKVRWIIVCVILLILVIYHLPRSHRVTMPVCTVEGNSATVDIDVKYYRRLFSLSYLKGTITVDGVICYDSKSAWGSRQKDGSYWDWYWYFGDADNTVPSNIEFIECTEYSKGIVKHGNNRLYIDYLGDNNTFNKIGFVYVSEDNPDAVAFYGPAQTAEEAEQIRNYKNGDPGK